MDSKEEFWNRNLNGYLFRCPTTTWLESCSNGYDSDRPILAQSIVERLNEGNSFDSHKGFSDLHKLLATDQFDENMMRDAVDAVTMIILQAAGDTHESKEDANTFLATHINMFYHLRYRPNGELELDRPDENVAVLMLSPESDEDANERSKRRITIGADVLMYNNPRRRYMYGVSLNGSTTTLWRFSRNAILMSESFDCQKRPDLFIRMVLFLGFAAREDLGYDTTLSMAQGSPPLPSTPSYVYDLGGRWYRTIGRPIYDYNHTYICSRSVRIWHVREVDEKHNWMPGAGENVLKDFWAEKGKASDTEVQQAIRERLRLLDMDGGHREQEMNTYFMKISHDNEVLINGKADVAPDLPTGSTPEEFIWSFDRPSNNWSDNKLHPAYTDQSAYHPVYSVHRRILFEEKCNRITELTDLPVMLDCFTQLCAGLNLMRQAEYVHRDISIGNCLVFQNNGTYQAKITDLEFCQDYYSIQSITPVEGTRMFMASEAINKRVSWSMDDDYMPTYHYHPLHDLEALYWVLTWLVLSREPSTCALAPDDKAYDEWRHHFSELFPIKASRRHYFNAKILMFSLKSTYGPWLSVMRSLGWENYNLYRPLFQYPFELRETYTQLETNIRQTPDTKKWPISVFSDHMYIEFRKMIAAVTALIPETQRHVRSISRKLRDAEKAAEEIS